MITRQERIAAAETAELLDALATRYPDRPGTSRALRLLAWIARARPDVVVAANEALFPGEGL
jgi:hypothetical protein